MAFLAHVLLEKLLDPFVMRLVLERRCSATSLPLGPPSSVAPRRPGGHGLRTRCHDGCPRPCWAQRADRSPRSRRQRPPHADGARCFCGHIAASRRGLAVHTAHGHGRVRPTALVVGGSTCPVCAIEFHMRTRLHHLKCWARACRQALAEGRLPTFVPGAIAAADAEVSLFGPS